MNINMILKDVVDRSGEEGHYSHLEQAAEDKLRKTSPNNPLLRVETHVTPTSVLHPAERELISNEMQVRKLCCIRISDFIFRPELLVIFSVMLQKWSEEMSSRENVLKDESMKTDDVPAVRNSAAPRVVNTVNEKNKMVRLFL